MIFKTLVYLWFLGDITCCYTVREYSLGEQSVVIRKYKHPLSKWNPKQPVSLKSMHMFLSYMLFIFHVPCSQLSENIMSAAHINFDFCCWLYLLLVVCQTLREILIFYMILCLIEMTKTIKAHWEQINSK